jgi:hypothetical protein
LGFPDRYTIISVNKKLFKKKISLIFIFLAAGSPLFAQSVSYAPCSLLRDYSSLLYGPYYGWAYEPALGNDFLSGPRNPDLIFFAANEEKGTPFYLDEEQKIKTEINLEGEINLDLTYGNAFTLKKGTVVGAGSSGITEGLQYDLIERVMLEGNVADRLFLEFDYDSERDEQGIMTEENTYSLLYRGKEGEFVEEASLGNKYLSMEGSRYVQIDEGTSDSFALRARAGWGNFSIESLLRYEVATQGKKTFKGYRNSMDMRVLDVDYVRGRYFLLPDTDIDEQSLLLFVSSDILSDAVIDGKNFTLLRRGIDYTFDNTSGIIYLDSTLGINEELVTYYEKNAAPVGDGSLGQDAIIDDTGARDDFNVTDYPDYFDGSGTYLYLKKNAFNSYWEMRNAYYLEDFEGSSLYNVEIELLYTVNEGINDNYESLLSRYRIDTERGVVLFNFEDTTGFYPRPFPGEEPYDPAAAPYPPLDPRNPFNPENPIYGGINYPTSESSINTIRIQYEYSAESFFLDFNLVPGSVSVTVNGAALDPAFYTVDHEFGIITFSEGAVGPTSQIVITYNYNPFGAGDQNLLAALGVGYQTGFLRARNLTAYSGGFKAEEAPDIGSEPSRNLTNSSAVEIQLGADEDEQGFSASLKGEVAFSFSNENAYGSAIVADMERESFLFDLSVNAENWIIGSTSTLLNGLPVPVSLGTRGDVLFKNYYKKTVFSGDTLQTLSWDIPSDQVFAYSDKAGPYNTADKPADGNDMSLVIDYEFSSSDTDPYAAVVKPISQQNLTDFERFNLIVRADDVTGNAVRVYAELLQTYNEDLDRDSIIDEERSINDRGFLITPFDGSATVIGSDREGNSNGRIDSEDINENGYLDLKGGAAEDGVVLVANASQDYLVEFTGDTGWQYLSVNILDIMDGNPEAFQYASALRITVTLVAPSDARGKILINKIWFSGSSIVNNSKDFLAISEVSVEEDPDVNANRFSRAYPSLYEELHGDSRYRSNNDLVEKTLKVFFDATTTNLTQGNEATLSRRFGTTADLTNYKTLKLFLYVPPSETIPADMSFIVRILSSQDEKLEATIQGSGFSNGWNEIAVELRSPYTVRVNGSDIGTMTVSAILSVLKRVSEIQFGFLADTGDLTSALEVWLDEWVLVDSEGVFDTALFTEGTFQYRGDLLRLDTFSLIRDPALTVGFERRQGDLYEEKDFKSDTYYIDVFSDVFDYVEADVSVRREKITQIRNEEQIPNDLDFDGALNTYSHSFGLDLEKSYIPSFQHFYTRTVSDSSNIELTKDDFIYRNTKLFNESLGIGEYMELPFGLYQSYTVDRSWEFQDKATGSSLTSFVLSSQESASLNQRNDFLISYGWNSNSASFNLKKDKVFTGSTVPHIESGFDSYMYRLRTLFQPPQNTLEDSTLSTKVDSYLFDFQVPLVRNVGFFFMLGTNYSESNFVTSNNTRDVTPEHSLYLSVPFTLFGDEKIRLNPSLERGYTGSYEYVNEGLSQSEVILRTYGPLFMPPFYYINPIKGLGRIKDYDAVNLFKDEPQISGNTKNTLVSRYSVETSLDYDRWYIPSSFGYSIYGETQREGGSYTQKRITEISVEKYFDDLGRGGFFDHSLYISFDYKDEKDYSTKVHGHTFRINTGLNLLKEEWKGFRIEHYFSFIQEKQKIGNENFYLFPGQPDKEVQVSEKPDRNKIEHESAFEYLWEYNLKKYRIFSQIGGESPALGKLQNTERFVLENIYTFTDREKSESFSNIPVRVTFEHLSSYRLTQLIEFGLNLKTVFGIEEKIIPPSTSGNTLTSMGFEVGVSTKIIF